jgi:hypothetical protein
LEGDWGREEEGSAEFGEGRCELALEDAAISAEVFLLVEAA